MVVEKLYEKISLKQSKWLEKYIKFKTQKRNKAANDFEKDFYEILNNAFYGKTMENVLTPMRLEFFKKDDYKGNIKQESKLTFNGIHKSYENCDSYVFRKNEVLMDKPIYLGFAVLDLGNLHKYKTYCDRLQPYFGHENIQSHYIDTDSFVLSENTKDIIKDLRKIEDIFDFSIVDGKTGFFQNRDS